MRNRKKIAGIALGVTVVSGIFGILCLAALGIETAAGTTPFLPPLHIELAFGLLIFVMAAATMVMALVIPKKK